MDRGSARDGSAGKSARRLYRRDEQRQGPSRTFTHSIRANRTVSAGASSSPAGEDADLDQAAAAWGAEAGAGWTPVSRMICAPVLARPVFVDDMGPAWRLKFHHAPSANDNALDVWATQRLQAEAWMEPMDGRFMRIDYTLPRPVRGPKGGRLTRFEQSLSARNRAGMGPHLCLAIRAQFRSQGSVSAQSAKTTQR